ncbi:MAG TPA: anti-sigma factor [Candidatus Acidoferrales bacterium]|nr:anti-sigma factor [Candidatus Acidoferrales bacterium]
MNCDDARILLHAHLDGELDLARDLEVQRHIADCPRCTPEYSAMLALRARLKDESLRYQAPAELKEKTRRAIAIAPGSTPASSQRPPGAYRRSMRLLLPLGAAAILALMFAPRAMGPSETQQLAREVVTSHVRSLMASHLMDVASTDQHTVKPWFDGKLDFSPPVTDFSKDGFPLVGGRLDYLGERPVAALVYQRGKHVINVFMWPAARDTTSVERIETQRGYNVEQLTIAGMNCWVVSDLNRAELSKFAALLKSHG